MIGNAFNIAVSGLQASSQRMQTSANNVANVSSTTSRIDGNRVLTPYQAQDTVQTSLESGGVQAQTRTKDPATVLLPDADNVAARPDGLTEYPNVNLEEEVIQQQVAKYDFKANLKVVEAADEMMENLLNIKA